MAAGSHLPLSLWGLSTAAHLLTPGWRAGLGARPPAPDRVTRATARPMAGSGVQPRDWKWAGHLCMLGGTGHAEFIVVRISMAGWDAGMIVVLWFPLHRIC